LTVYFSFLLTPYFFTMTDYKKVALDNFEEIKNLLQGDRTWTKILDENSTEIFETSIPPNPIGCFRAVGIVDGAPEKLFDVLWNARDDTWKKIDDSLTIWKIVEELDENNRILYQVNKLPWPLWARDCCMTQSKFVDNGSYNLCLRSVTHPKAPLDEANYVRAQVLISLFRIEPAGEGKSKVTRMILVDPCGVIPTPVINMNAKRCNAIILWLRQNAK